jgi:hypothetical protein
MTPKQYLDSLPADRKILLTKLRDLILKSDPLVREVVSSVMGREALVFLQGDIYKYALVSLENHMSFHSMVMYGAHAIRANYQKMMPKVMFQKGCITFKSGSQLPIPLVERFIKDMAAVDYPPPQHKARVEKLAQLGKKRREAERLVEHKRPVLKKKS